MRAYHVTSTLNRASIAEHGLDWEHMGAAPGIAGSRAAEVAGIYLCQNLGDVDFFVRMNNTHGPVDVWLVEGVDPESLVDNGSGFMFVRRKIPAAHLTLVRQDLDAV